MDKNTKKQLIKIIPVTGLAGILIFILTDIILGITIISSLLITLATVISIPSIWIIITAETDEYKGKDERERKIQDRSSYYALLTTLCFIFAAMYLSFLFEQPFGIPGSLFRDFLSIIAIVIGISLSVFLWYLNKKGDVE